MTLIVETGQGVQGADSYASVARIDAHWSARPQAELAATWAAADTEIKEGAARAATDYLDDMLSQFYLGMRGGYLQGLEWPRTGARDDNGLSLPDLPPQLVKATCEMAARALTGPLSSDAAVRGAVTSESVGIGPLREQLTYADGVSQEAKYGLVLDSLAPILDGRQPGAAPQWNWA